MKYRIFVSVAVAALWSVAASAALIITGAPNGSSSTMRARYEPLARYLSHKTGSRVVFSNTESLVVFGLWVKRGRPAIIFGGPQLISWASKYYGYVPVLAGRGSLAFALVAQRHHVRTLSDLQNGDVVCGLPEPNLSTEALMVHFSNPIRQPYILPVGSPAQALSGVMHGRCVAAAVPSRFAIAHDASFHVVTQLGRWPNQGFAVSGRIPAALRQRIASALVAAARAGVLRSLGKGNGITGWYKPKPSLYVGYSSMVHGVLGYGVAAAPTAQ